MTRETMDQMLKIGNEDEARQLANKCLEEYRREIGEGEGTAEEWLGDALRWVFGNEDMPFDRISMWSRIAAELRT